MKAKKISVEILSMDIITETQRLLVAKIDKGDADLLFQLTGDEQVMKYLPKALSYDETRRMINELLNHYEKYGFCFWKLLLKPENEFIGIAGLLHQEIDANEETEISYRIKPEYWNNGYATEAALACKEYAEKVLDKKRLVSIIHPENIASKCVAQKLGAKKSKTAIFLGMEHEIYVY